MKYKVSELEGALLDAAVLLAEGMTPLAARGYPYSSNWEYGGPLIERERISINAMVDDTWDARWVSPDGDKEANAKACPTALIAAMRAWVVSKFGEEVELP